jgi:Tfp pilus assembly protein PilF
MSERIEKIKEFLVLTPDDSFLKHALALEYIKIGEDQKARALFEDLLERDPGYIGSYYHLGKLLERVSETGLAVGWYEKGMTIAKANGDQHAFNELYAAREELAD